MNKERRNKIMTIVGKLQDIEEEIQAILDEEQDYFDNMPESLQGGEKGSAAEGAINDLESALQSCTETADSLNEAAV